jgi:hypothetical protein
LCDPINIHRIAIPGGRLLDFNIDPDFNNALDGLIMVNLRKTALNSLQYGQGVSHAASQIPLGLDLRYSPGVSGLQSRFRAGI